MTEPDTKGVEQQTTGWRSWIARRLFSFALIYMVVLLLLFSLENRLIFPAPRYPDGDWDAEWLEHEDIDFVAADGTKLHGWYLDHPSPKAYLLYCHGNGEHVAYTARLLSELRTTLGVAVFAFDYRGYGRSEGSAHEAGVLSDGEAAHQWLQEQANVDADQIVLMGRSLGGAVAVHLANKHRSRVMILESTFPSMPDVAARLHRWAPVRLFMKTQLRSIDKIANFNGSLFQSHGTADTLIPMDFGKRLFDAAPTADKHFLAFDGFGHNDYPPDEYYKQLRTFINRTTSLQSTPR